MPRGDKGRRFSKGNPGGPGRPKKDLEVQELRELDRADLEKLVRNAMQMTEKQISEKLKDPECQAKDRLALRIILRGIAKGDAAVLGFLTDFTFGERPKQINFKGASTVAIGNMDKTEIKDFFKRIEEEV